MQFSQTIVCTVVDVTGSVGHYVNLMRPLMPAVIIVGMTRNCNHTIPQHTKCGIWLGGVTDADL